MQGQDWRRFAVLTLHRPSNVDSLETLTGLLGAIDAIAADVPVISLVHPRTQQRLVQAGIVHHPQLRLTSPIGYLDFLRLLSRATLVLTDSGEIQEEPPRWGCRASHSAKIRSALSPSPTVRLSSSEPIRGESWALLEGKSKAGRVPPLWDGKSAERIVEILLRLHSEVI